MKLISVYDGTLEFIEIVFWIIYLNDAHETELTINLNNNHEEGEIFDRLLRE